MRDALSLLDRMLSAAGEKLTVATLEQMLGLPRSQQVFELAQSIGESDIKNTLVRINTLIVAGLSPDTLVGALVDHYRNLLILHTCGPDSELVEVPGLPLVDLVRQSKGFDAVSLAQGIVILEELRRQLRTSNAGRALMDAVAVRLALAGQFTPIDTLLNDVDADARAAEKKK
jgi:DNA polymerase III subunit gamma/tau